MQLLLIGTLAGALAGCHGSKARITPPGDDAWKEKMKFEITEGMPRWQVEAELGQPTQTGMTKEGNQYVMYKIEGAPDGYYRSVVYNKKG